MTPQVMLGLALILIGAAFLFSKLVDVWAVARFAWPAIIIALGLIVILRARR